MTDDDDRAGRLSRRRSTGRHDDQNETPEDVQEQAVEQGTDESKESATVKEALHGTYLYLEPAQKDKLDHLYNRLKADYEFEYDDELTKNAHFYRVFASVGLEGLENMDASDLRERLQSLESLEEIQRKTSSEK